MHFLTFSSRSHLLIKTLEIGQTFVRMVGYTFKDKALPHFRNINWGITEEEITKGIEEHAMLKLSYVDDKIMLTKPNLFLRAYSYYQNNHCGEVMQFDETLAQMINSKKYVLSATIFMNGAGQMLSLIHI